MGAVIVFIVVIRCRRLRTVTQNVVEAESLIHVHQELPQNFAVFVTAVRRKHRLGNALIQMFPDLIHREKGDGSPKRPDIEDDFCLMHCGFCRRGGRESLGLGICSYQLPQQRCLTRAGGAKEERAPILGILRSRQRDDGLANGAEVVLVGLHAMKEDLNDPRAKALFGLTLCGQVPIVFVP